MKNVSAFLKRHSALLLLVLVLATVPAGIAFGKYVKSVNVTSGISIDVQMKEYVLKEELGKYIHGVCALPNKITICKKSEVPNGLAPQTSGGNLVDLGYDNNSGSIYIYKDSSNNIYIAPADSDAVIYAPVNANYMFHVYNGSGDGFTELDTHNLNTSRSEKMSHMFDGMKRVTHLDLSGFDTSNVTDMSYMFYRCEGLTSITFGGKFDSSNVTNMSYMFSNMNAITKHDLHGLDTSSATNMHGMFANNKSLTSIDFGDTFKTANVTTMEAMFWSDERLGNLDLSCFDTSSVTNMNSMFYWTASKAYSTSVNLSSFKTSNVTTMQQMFHYTGFSILDLSSFDTSNVTNMIGMFSGWSGSNNSHLQKIIVGDGFVTTNVPAGTNMFVDCKNLVGGAGTRYSSAQVDDVSYARIDGGPNSNTPGYFTDKNASSTSSAYGSNAATGIVITS